MIDKTKLYCLLPGFWITPGEIALLEQGTPYGPNSPYWKLALKAHTEIIYLPGEQGQALDDFLTQWAEEFKD